MSHFQLMTAFPPQIRLQTKVVKLANYVYLFQIGTRKSSRQMVFMFTDAFFDVRKEPHDSPLLIH